jgi:hypothetical protein
MTSYTKKLHRISPVAARQIRRRELHEYRYGCTAALALFTPEPVFGIRPSVPSTTPFYVKSQGMPARVISAADSFAARREYADFYKLPITCVTATARSYRHGNKVRA